MIFSWFRVVKWNFTTVGAPWKNAFGHQLEKSIVAPTEKNLFDAHVWYIPHILIFREGSSFRPKAARREVPCWQQQLECEWNAKPQNCETDAQGYWAAAGFWQCSCTAKRRGRKTQGRGPVPVLEEIVTGPCGTKAKFVQKWLKRLT